MEPAWSLGLMTGTVLDGNVDIAMIRTDGEDIAEFGPWTLSPYPEPVNAIIAEAVAAAREWQFDGPEPAVFAKAEAALTSAQSDAVAAFLKQQGVPARNVAAVGLHGQTVLHRAPTAVRKGATRQLGDGALMAGRLGIDVVADFRSADVEAGGQGAPLAAVYHAALLRKAGIEPPAAVLNLGGVGNLTWWGGGGRLVAFDTGPANGPVNDWIGRHTGGRMDTDGRLAAAGRVDEDRLSALLRHGYLATPPPKSLDRYDFTADMADGLSLEDGAALLTAFSAGCVARGIDLLPGRPSEIVICGGGRKNPTLVAEIAQRAGVRCLLAEDRGWRGDAVEAECFAFLAVRALRGRPYSFPETTGASAPICGGRMSRATQQRTAAQ